MNKILRSVSPGESHYPLLSSHTWARTKTPPLEEKYRVAMRQVLPQRHLRLLVWGTLPWGKKTTQIFQSCWIQRQTCCWYDGPITLRTFLLMSYEGEVNKVSSQVGLDISPVSLWMHAVVDCYYTWRPERVGTIWWLDKTLMLLPDM